MAGEQMNALLQHLRKVLDTPAASQLTDVEALRRFATQRDESAFAALMQRHGRLVLGVCQHVLRHEQDAEDAFQATFLVLARQAGSIRKERSVASWLYGVAYRVAMKARRAAARRHRHEAQAPAPAEGASPSDLSWRELQAVLDEELNRLPEKYRRPFILCCLESRSKKEAAEELGWKEGTVSSRLAQARKLLQERLARRGVTLSAVLAGVEVAREGATAAVPVAVAATTMQAALSFAAGGPGVSAQAVAWARAVLRGQALARAKLPLALLLLVGLAGGGTAALMPRPPAPPATDAGEAAPGVPRVEAPRPAARPDRAGPPNEGVMTVAGRVTTPGGPVPGARIAVLTDRYREAGEPYIRLQNLMRLLGSGTTDDQGGFRLEVPQTGVRNNRVMVLASTPGHALAAGFLDRFAHDHEVPLQLKPAQVFRGRLLGPDGRPARGVRVHVVALERQGAGGFTIRFRKPPDALPVWPGPATTDDEGGFTLDGLGPNFVVDAQVHDERYATQRLPIRTGPTERAGAVTFRLAPARVLEGRITGADSGLPLSGARVSVSQMERGANLPTSVDVLTGADGRFRLRPFPGKEYELAVYPPPGAAYLVVRKRFRWPAGAARHTLSLPLRRGVLVRGQVREEGSGRPVAGAAVECRQQWLTGEGPGVDRADPSLTWWTQDTRTAADGSFALAAFRAPGHLLVRGPTPDYLHTVVESNRLEFGQPGGTHYFPDAVVRFDPGRGRGPLDVSATLRRGVTIRGRVVGPDGKPVASALLVAPNYIPLGQEMRGDPLPVRDGRFELPGCDPKKTVRAWFFDRQGRQGACVDLPGDSKKEPVVRLVPCRDAVVGVVDRAGRPVARPRLMLSLVLRPGDPKGGPEAREDITVYSWMLYGRGFGMFEGSAGQVAIPWLIPGGRYALGMEETLGWPIKKVFTVAPGRGVIQLGNVAINPRPKRNPPP